jgi:membrane associated rhomboid family serine protease
VLSLIPIHDANPTQRKPLITLGFIILCVVAWLQTPGLGGNSQSLGYFYEHAPVPCQALEDRCPDEVSLGTDSEGRELTIEVDDPSTGPFVFSMLFSTFLHGGFLHLAGNMVFLWVFGNNIEDNLGHIKYALFYLLGGLAASGAHVLWALRDVSDACLQNAAACESIQPYVPSVGASGAVAAVMGAYIVLFPRARVRTLVIFFFITVIEMSAFAVLALWFVYQFIIAAQELAGEANEVAWMAHVGGFVYGAIAIFLLGGRPRRRQAAWQTDWRY